MYSLLYDRVSAQNMEEVYLISYLRLLSVETLCAECVTRWNTCWGFTFSSFCCKNNEDHIHTFVSPAVKFLETFQHIYKPDSSQNPFLILKKMNLVTFEPHDSILTTLKEQLIYNKGGRDRLRSCGVDFWVVVLQRHRDA